MSFTRMAPNPRDVKPRCHRCSKTRNVRTVGRNDLCAKCRRIETETGASFQSLVDRHVNELLQPLK